MSSLDLTIVGAYIAGLFGVGVAVGLRENAEDFFVLSRRAGFFLVLSSVVSSWVGVGMFVGTTASTYQTGVSFGLTGAAGALVAVIAAGIFAPKIKAFGDEYGAHTLGDFLRVRYSPASGKAAAVVIVGIYLLLTGVQFTGLTVLLQVWTGFGLGTTLVIAAVSTVVYTAFAGIKSDFYTDAIHFVIMVAVLFGLLLPRLWNATDAFATVRSLPGAFFEPFAFGGVAYFIGGLVLGVGIVFVSMEVWQRIYAATSAKTARWALVSSGLIIVPFYVLAVVIGLSARSLDGGISDPNMTLFVMMRDHLPVGLLGLGIAAFIALFVSSANTMIMVVSATVTKDLLAQRKRSPAMGPGIDLLRVGRITTLIAGLGGLAASFFVRDIVTLSVVAIFLLLVLLPAVLAGFFWPKATARGAYWSIVGGTLAYIAALPFSVTNAFVPGLVASIGILVCVSLMTSHSDTEKVIALASRHGG